MGNAVKGTQAPAPAPGLQVALASAKGSPGVTTLALALGLVWPKPVLVGELDPAGGDLVARLPLERSGGLAALAAAARHTIDGEQLAAHAQPVTEMCSLLLGPCGSRRESRDGRCVGIRSTRSGAFGRSGWALGCWTVGRRIAGVGDDSDLRPRRRRRPTQRGRHRPCRPFGRRPRGGWNSSGIGCGVSPSRPPNPPRRPHCQRRRRARTPSGDDTGAGPFRSPRGGDGRTAHGPLGGPMPARRLGTCDARAHAPSSDRHHRDLGEGDGALTLVDDTRTRLHGHVETRLVEELRRLGRPLSEEDQTMLRQSLAAEALREEAANRLAGGRELLSPEEERQLKS